MNKIYLTPLLTLLILSFTSSGQVKDSVAGDSINLNQKILPKGDIREHNPLLTGSDLVDDNFIGSWPMFGKEFRMKVGGYVKADFLYDFAGSFDQTQFLMSTIPVKGQPNYNNSGYINLFARETRFNFDVRRVTPAQIPLKLFIEADFWTASNQLRLRHAYVVVGDFIIGQTWTTLSFLESLPFMIDFASGDALYGGRSTQIRYQNKVSKQLQLTASLEKIDFLGIENSNNLRGKASSNLPLLVGRLDYSWGTGILFFGANVGQLRWDNDSSLANPTAIQYSAVIAGRQYLGKNNYFTWNINYGRGAGENIMAFAGSSANAVLTADGGLETMQSYGILLGFMHKWTNTISSNFSYAYGWLETPPSRAAFALQDGGIGHLNLIYSPTDYLSYGTEFIWGTRRTANDALGSANRIQAMVKLSF